MKPVIPVVSLLLLLLLATTTQGIRLDEETLAAFHNKIHEKGTSSMGGVSKVAGVAPCGINGHSSGTMKESSIKEVKEVHPKQPGSYLSVFHRNDESLRKEALSTWRSRKLMNKNMATVKKERSEETVFDSAQSHHHSKEAIHGSSGEDLHVEPPFSKQPQTYPDTLDIAGMDYSPAKRKPPIHN
ncbi:putative Peptidase B [Cocos nucifera]|uniref:Putative Peptidase B n=1 Tax=Cocos nucifera TaxID=13894 RepID=A0A8K0HX86_COCNU|nr:putative Peptidase B [Cocos nucifera]